VYGFLRQGKWVALTLLLVVLVPLSAVAADWQYNRWQSRKELNAVVASNSAARPIAIADVLEPGSPVTDSNEWRQVSATGRYVAELTKLVRRQVVNGRTGYIVITPLVTDDGRVAVIERGFIPPASNGQDTQAPAAPAGEVTVVGRLRHRPEGDVEVQPADLPPNQVNRVDPLAIAKQQSRPGYDAVIEALASSPADSTALTLLPAPQLDEGPHLSYVGQWFLIGIASLVIWIIMVRREAAYQRELNAPAA